MTKHQKKMGIAYILFAVLLIVVAVAGPEVGVEYYGFWSFLPIIFVFAFIILTTHPAEGFLMATILAMFITNRWDVFTAMPEELMATLMDYDSLYMFLLFLLLGIPYMILKKSGAGTYFANMMAKAAKSEKSSLLLTAFVGAVLFIDDYLGAFTAGSTMSPVNDKHKVPREMSAYVVRASVTTPGLLVPIGSWFVWMASLMEQNGFTESMNSTQAFYKVVPYLFYPFMLWVVMLLVIFGVIPKFGKMKKAYERVAAGGPASPVVEGEEREGEEVVEPRKGVNLLHFLVPIGSLVAFAFLFDFHLIYALIWSSLVSFIFFIATKVFSIADCTAVCYDGFTHMGELAMMLLLGYSLCNVVGAMGFTEYVVGLTESFLSPTFFPLIIFVVFSITEFMVTFNWTLYLIAMPVIVALCGIIGTNPFLAVGALTSAGVWGYTAAFSADGGICASTACDVNMYEQSTAQLPYMLITWAASAVLYGIFGFIV